MNPFLSFGVKTLETRIAQAAGSFGGAGEQTVISGLATELTVEKPGLPDKNFLKLKIWNLPLDTMEKLTTLAFRPLETQRNVVSVLAGSAAPYGTGGGAGGGASAAAWPGGLAGLDSRGGATRPDANTAVQAGQSLVFTGEITSAFGNFNAAPDPVFELQAMSGYYPALLPSPPTVLPGVTPLERCLSRLADAMGYAFRNEGITGSLRNAVLNGSPLEQAQTAAAQAGVQLLVEDSMLIALPPGAARVGEPVPVGKESGLIGYPTFNNEGIVLQCLYNPAIVFNGRIEVRSMVPKATGIWRVTRLSHHLAAFKPGAGPWVSHIEAAYAEGK